MLKFNHKECLKKAVFGLRMFFATAAFFIVLGGLFSTPMAQAQETSGLANNAGLDNLAGQVYLPETDIRVFIFRLINIALSFLGIILLGLIIYGGWLWMTSEGDPGKIEKAKAIFKNAAIGLVIILSSFGIVNFILKALWGGEGGGGTRPGTAYDVGVGALGDGIIESHYPARGQIDVPRNTMIIITFKEVLDPKTVCGAANCDGKTVLKTENISIFSTANGAESREDADDAKVAAKIISAKVESKDNKTFVFRPDKFLGNQNQEQWYGVRLFGGKLKKSNGDAVKLGVADYYQWKFQVSTRLDLTPPQVSSIFPQPDNEADVKIIAGNAKQASWTITVIKTPNYFTPSTLTVSYNMPTGVTINGKGAQQIAQGVYQGCRGDNDKSDITYIVSIDSKTNAVSLVLNGSPKIQVLNGSAIIKDGKADIGCGLIVSFPEKLPNNGSQIKFKVTEESAGDKISISGQDYIFGKEIKTGDSAGIANALKDNQLISAQAPAALPQVTLTAKPDKFPGKAGNNLEISVSNVGALTLKQITEGKDKEEGYATKGLPDQPRNAVIQINFNEAMNPIQLQGDSETVKDYIKILNLNNNAPINGEFIISNLYKTVEFKTNVKCGQNSCGDEMYCLPPLANIKVWVKAASLATCKSNEECTKTSGNQLNFGACSKTDGTDGICQQDSGGKKINYPQASLAMDGAMDAAANSLDGNRNGNAEGPKSEFSENDLYGICAQGINNGTLCTAAMANICQGGDAKCAKFNDNINPVKTLSALQSFFGDNYTWSFWTSDKIDLASPIIESAKSKELSLVKVENNAGKQVVGASAKEPVKIYFDKLMMSSTLKPGRNYPDDFYFNPDPKVKVQREYFIFQNFSSVPLGYWVSKIDSDDSSPADGFADKTTAVIDHTTLSDNGAYGFVIGSGAKDIYQNCYNPAADKEEGENRCGSGLKAGDSCCKGVKSSLMEKCYKF